jgi:flagellar motility protein MotE (MotC chaperone)
MIGKLIRLFSALFVYACVATILAGMAGLAYFWWAGMLSNGKLVKFLAVAYDISVEKPTDETKGEAEPLTLVAARRLGAQRERDLDLRDQSLDSRLDEYRFLKKDIEEKKAHYDKLFEGFKSELSKLQDEARTAGRAKARTMLENLPSDQAKTHLLTLIKDQGEQGLVDAVGLISDMPIDASKKIMSRFNVNDPEESDAFNRIINMMRDGEPITSLVESTRGKLNAESGGPAP